jgi:hypothetical protein
MAYALSAGGATDCSEVRVIGDATISVHVTRDTAYIEIRTGIDYAFYAPLVTGDLTKYYILAIGSDITKKPVLIPTTPYSDNTSSYFVPSTTAGGKPTKYLNTVLSTTAGLALYLLDLGTGVGLSHAIIGSISVTATRHGSYAGFGQSCGITQSGGTYYNLAYSGAKPTPAISTGVLNCLFPSSYTCDQYPAYPPGSGQQTTIETVGGGNYLQFAVCQATAIAVAEGATVWAVTPPAVGAAVIRKLYTGIVYPPPNPKPPSGAVYEDAYLILGIVYKASAGGTYSAVPYANPDILLTSENYLAPLIRNQTSISAGGLPMFVYASKVYGKCYIVMTIPTDAGQKLCFITYSGEATVTIPDHPMLAVGTTTCHYWFASLAPTTFVFTVYDYTSGVWVCSVSTDDGATFRAATVPTGTLSSWCSLDTTTSTALAPVMVLSTTSTSITGYVSYDACASWTTLWEVKTSQRLYTSSYVRNGSIGSAGINEGYDIIPSDKTSGGYV